VAVTRQVDTNPADPITPPGDESFVTATRVCFPCRVDRMIVIAVHPPMTHASGDLDGARTELDLRQLVTTKERIMPRSVFE
jgi:hypothetical protein